MRVIVLEADLEFDGLEEVSLLLVEGVVQKRVDLLTDSCDCDFRHLESVFQEIVFNWYWLVRL